MNNAVLDAMRTTGSARYFSHEPVEDDVVLAAIEAARFGPSGGNRQPVRWIIVRDPAVKGALADLYLPLWKRDMKAFLGGAMTTGSALGPAVRAADDFAEGLRDVPVILVACAVVADLHAHMTGPDGPNLLAGSSVYPIVQNACLALRSLDVATTITTLICEREAEAKEILALPDGLVCACHIAVGRPANGFPRKLTRLPVEDLVSNDRYAG